MQGEETFRNMVEHLSGNDRWLLFHIVIAFWHTFGLSNGLRIDPKTDLQTVHYKEGPDGHYVRAEAMEKKLDEYLQWLQRYQASWGTSLYDTTGANVLSQVFDTSSASWAKVVKMLEMLQIGLPPAIPPDAQKNETN